MSKEERKFYDRGWEDAIHWAIRVIERNYFAGPTRDMIICWLLNEVDDNGTA